MVERARTRAPFRPWLPASRVPRSRNLKQLRIRQDAKTRPRAFPRLQACLAPVVRPLFAWFRHLLIIQSLKTCGGTVPPDVRELAAYQASASASISPDVILQAPSP